MAKNKIISLDTIVTRNKELEATDMDGELVMMDMLKGKYYSINNVGSRIWELIEKQISVIEVTSTLLNEFEVDAKTCTDTVIDFLNGLYNEDLITIV